MRPRRGIEERCQRARSVPSAGFRGRSAINDQAGRAVVPLDLHQHVTYVLKRFPRGGGVNRELEGRAPPNGGKDKTISYVLLCRPFC